MIPQSFIDEVLRQTNIVELIQQYLPLTKKGDNYWACCPFHHEKTASFSVSDKKQFYYCFGCQSSGHALRFIMEYKQLGFIEAMQELAEALNLTIPQSNHTDPYTSKDSYELLGAVTTYYEKTLKANQTAIQYLKQRQLTGSIAKQYRLGFAPKDWDTVSKLFKKNTPLLLENGLAIKHKTGRIYDRFRDRIIFPVRDVKGHTIAFAGRTIDQTEPKYLNSPETKLFHKKKTVYGLYESLIQNKERNLPEILVVEGYMDVIGLAQAGYTYAVACMGTALTQQHISLIKRYTKKVIFCFDGDEAGKQAAFKTIETLLNTQLNEINYYFVFLPKAHDPDSYVKEKGLAAFKDAIAKALSFDESIIYYLSDHYDTHTITGRSQLIEKTKTIIQQIPNNTLGELIIEKLSLICQLPTERLKAMCEPRSRNMPSRILKGPQTVWQKAIVHLINYPYLAHDLQDTTCLDYANRQEAIHLKKLITIAQKFMVKHTQQLIQHAQEELFLKSYLSMATVDPMLSAEQSKVEFLNCIQHIEQNLNQERIDKFIKDSRRRTLNQDEKQTLTELIQKLKKNKSIFRLQSQDH